MEISVEEIKTLREQCGAGVLDCRKALIQAEGDIEEAVRLLREKGMAAVAKRAGRETNEGRIESYVHHGNRIGVLVELNCETDFVARTVEFIDLSHDLAMQVAATDPRFLSIEDVPEEVVEEERAIYRAQVEGSKPDHIIERIVEGKLKKFYEEACLMEQPFIRDPDRQVKDLVAEVAAQVGENIVVGRFIRFEVGKV